MLLLCVILDWEFFCVIPSGVRGVEGPRCPPLRRVPVAPPTGREPALSFAEGSTRSDAAGEGARAPTQCSSSIPILFLVSSRTQSRDLREASSFFVSF